MLAFIFGPIVNASQYIDAKGDIYLQLVRTRETNLVLNIAVV